MIQKCYGERRLPPPKLKLEHICATTVACIAEACVPYEYNCVSKWVGGVCFQYSIHFVAFARNWRGAL